MALITGAGQGIGKATVLKFVQEGCHVIATDVNEKALQELQLANPQQIRVEKLDVTDKNGIWKLASNVDKLDILFNCAGYVHQGTILECQDSNWELSFAVNVTGMYHMCQAFLPTMLTRGKGNIINMSSVCSSIKGAERRFAYGTTKGAVLGLSKQLAADYVSKNIRVNCICPGTVDTPSLQQRIQEFDDPQQAYKDFVSRQKMKRLGTAEEIAATAAFLASDESGYMTGQEVVIDGGWAI